MSANKIAVSSADMGAQDSMRLMVSLPGRARRRWTQEPSVTDAASYVAWLKDHDAKGDKHSRPFVPCSFVRSPGRRSNSNLDLRYAATLDADKACEDFPEKVREALEPLGIGAVLHTTASHTSAQPRWRVHVVYDRGAEPGESLSVATDLIQRIGIEYFDVQASTSPAHVAYAPSMPGIEWVEVEGKPLAVDDRLLVVPLLPWNATDSIGAITLDEWRDAHPVSFETLPTCRYGRTVLAQIETEMLDTPEGSGVHQKIYHATRRAIELVGAGCWSLNDVDRLRDISLGMRTHPRPEEWPEALINGLKKGDAAVSACQEHGEGADSDPVDVEDAEDDAWETFTPLDLVGLLDPDRPPRDWFWEGLVPTGDQASIVAPGGTGKSLLTLGLALKAAAGETTFIGRRISLDGQIFYVDMENSEDDWAERLRSYGFDQESIARIASRLHVLSLPPLVGLDTKRGAAQLKGWLKSMGAKAGDLLVLDSMQRITEGEENSNDTLRSLYNFTSQWLKSMGVTTIRTDNTGKDESLGARGASAKRDDVGYSLTLKARGKGRFSLESTKHRAAGDGGLLTFDRILDPGDGRLTWVPVAATTGTPGEDFDLPRHLADTLVALWMLTDPSSDVQEGDRVYASVALRLVAGKNDLKRNGIEWLVSQGYADKGDLLLQSGKVAAHPGFRLDEKGREWIEAQGEGWLALRRADLATRAPR